MTILGSTRLSGTWTALTVALLLALGSSTARAHNVAADLSVWGNFGAETARCQRSVGRAAALCAGRVLAARTHCLGDQVSGESCDESAVEARIQAARSRAVAMVTRDCTAPQLQTLRYIDLSDAQQDVVALCRSVDTAATTAAYGPVMFGGTVSAVEDEEERTCLETTGRVTAKLLRFAMRARQEALDEIASTNIVELANKTRLLERSRRMIERATELLRQRIVAACPGDTFSEVYGREVDDFLARIAGRADCLGESVYVQNAVLCPAGECGDGMQTGSEECDDGNAYEGDACRADCVKTNCDLFPTTYDLIQKAIFENHGCTSLLCHDTTAAGGLDLRAGHSYENLVDVEAMTVPGTKRLDPGSKDTSLLWLNLAARTLPDQYTATLRGMPLGLDPISPDELEALRLWIEGGGASRTANVAAAAQLLDACVPEPVPNEIEPLPPPAAGAGIQLHMPVWTLPAQSESEVCFASYYDVSDQIPAALLSPDGKSFRFKSVEIRQDPLSHHLIVDVYRGAEGPGDPAWGAYSCKGGALAGTACDPLELGFCGDGECATDPDANAIACIGFGPTTGFGTLGSGGLAFAQETTAFFRFPTKVYDELPVRGVILWNSHAFNLTRRDGTLEAWANILFPAADDQVFVQKQIFDASRIFWKDFPPIPPPELAAFDEMEICNLHTFKPDANSLMTGGSELHPGETAHLFELSGHMHSHGTRFQILRGAFTCSDGPNAGVACSPFEPEMCPAGACLDAGGREPDDALLYTNFIYNDPVVLRFDDPILISGSAPEADRTLTYCAHYDNGVAPNFEKVKRRSTSPPGGQLFGQLTIGGPCAVSKTRCIGGPQHNQLCNGNDAMCDSSAGGDGDCDACPLTGGFRTQDEMFILFGNFWVTTD